MADPLAIELALARVNGELARELPAHVRAFALAFARGEPEVGAPAVASAPSTLALARQACAHASTRAGGLALLRLVAPLAIEADPRVARARASEPSWPALAALAAARDAAARALFGEPALELMHRLHGSTDGAPERDAEVPAAIAGWNEPDGALEVAAIDDVWRMIAARFRVSGRVRVERGPRARAFVVEPGAEVIVVVPGAVATSAARFTVLHELGHAALALATTDGTPRVLDEAVAAYVARAVEPASWLPAPWPTALATAARARRLAIARALAAVERGLPALPAALPAATPPWALWHDPWAQAAYVAAEALADVLARDLDHAPHAFAQVVARERARIDGL